MKPSRNLESTESPNSLPPLIALVGNPNAGKTTLFNALTGSHQKVGNYAGVTVERYSGSLKLGDLQVECLDVPGLYSLVAISEDERVALEAIEGSPLERRPDLLLCVVDATNLERNLYFFSQLAEGGFPTVIALTMVDRLHAKGESIDVRGLAERLGVEVISLENHKAESLEPLKEALLRNLQDPKPPAIEVEMPPDVEEAISRLSERLHRTGIDAGRVEVRHLLTDGGSVLENHPEHLAAFNEARETLFASGQLKATTEVASRYQWAAAVQRAVVRTNRPSAKSLTDRIDEVLTHRVFGLMIFVGIMYGVFLSIYSFATPFMNAIEAVFLALQEFVGPKLSGNPALQSLIVDGVLAGVGGVVAFLPQILILFFYISVLEGSGYLARAAFLMDRLLGWCGLNGRAFIPLLSSFACAIPGIMAARVMPDPKSRLATILVAPLMSCSARLPVYLLLIGATIQPRFGPFWAGFALFAMHLLGLIVAVPIVWLLNRGVIKGKRLPFHLELPPYQWPKARDIWLAMYFRAQVFLKTAGTIIVVMSIAIWALSYYPRLEPTEVAQITQQVTEGKDSKEADKKLAEAQLERSLLGRFGKAIEPAFRPAGFDWRITTSILAAFPARETVVPSLGIIFSLGKDVDAGSGDLTKALTDATWPDGKPLFTPWTTAGLMVFFALCAQCMATLATVRRETNSWKWPVVMFTYMTTLAYVAAVLVNQLGIALTPK